MPGTVEQKMSEYSGQESLTAGDLMPLGDGMLKPLSDNQGPGDGRQCPWEHSGEGHRKEQSWQVRGAAQISSDLD